MISQFDQARLLHALHIKGDPLVLINVWDAGSARTVEKIGAKAIATGSWSVAAAHGIEEGEKLSLELVLTNLQRIKESIELPLTVDIEGGYGQSPSQVRQTILKVIDVGAAGINIEDQANDGDGLYTIEDQCLRIAAAREAAEQKSIPLFINARTDIFLQAASDHHHSSHIEAAVERSYAYAEAGADGFFVPGLSDAAHIETLCRLSPLPVNIMVTSNTPHQLAQLGVARISYGPHPYQQAMDALTAVGRSALSMA